MDTIEAICHKNRDLDVWTEKNLVADDQGHPIMSRPHINTSKKHTFRKALMVKAAVWSKS